MMKRLQRSVLDPHPDLVVWQVGTNAVLHHLDSDMTASMVQDGVARVQAAGSDVVLVDLQYSPRRTEHHRSASRMVRALGKVARLWHIGIFPRFEVMREWQKAGPPDRYFVIADGTLATGAMPASRNCSPTISSAPIDQDARQCSE